MECYSEAMFSLNDGGFKLLGAVQMNLIDLGNRQTMKDVVDNAKSVAGGHGCYVKR